MIGFTSYGILNSNVSYKYEVEDVLYLGPSEETQIKKKYLESTLFELKITLVFALVNFGIGSYLIFSKPKQSQNVV